MMSIPSEIGSLLERLETRPYARFVRRAGATKKAYGACYLEWRGDTLTARKVCEARPSKRYPRSELETRLSLWSNCFRVHDEHNTRFGDYDEYQYLTEECESVIADSDNPRPEVLVGNALDALYRGFASFEFCGDKDVGPSIGSHAAYLALGCLPGVGPDVPRGYTLHDGDPAAAAVRRVLRESLGSLHPFWRMVRDAGDGSSDED